MSFDAGSIKSTLDLDTTSFKHGFEEAHTHAEHEGGKIRELLESLAEVMTEVVGPAAGEMAEKLQSALAGFSEGPLVGALNLAGMAAGAVREATEGAGAAFHQMGLEATKAGVSVEFLSKLSAVSSTVGISLEQLGVGFKIMEQRAVEAAEGSKKQVEAFERLGISAQEAGKLSEEPEKLFEAIQESIAKLPTQAERTTAALAVMGRQGASLTPIFTMSREEFDKTGEAMQRLGGTMSDEDVKQGEALGKLEGYFHAAFLGIERAASAPVLKFFDEHMSQIEPKLEMFAHGGVVVLSAAWSALGAVWDRIQPTLAALGKELEDSFQSMGGMQGVMDKVTAGFKAEWPEIKSDLDGFATFIKDIEPLVMQAAHAVEFLANKMNGLTGGPTATPAGGGATGEAAPHEDGGGVGPVALGERAGMATRSGIKSAYHWLMGDSDASSPAAGTNASTGTLPNADNFPGVRPGSLQNLINQNSDSSPRLPGDSLGGLQNLINQQPAPQAGTRADQSRDVIPPSVSPSASDHLNDRVSQLVNPAGDNHSDQGGRGAARGERQPAAPNNITVQVTDHIDHKQTAAAVAALLLPAIQKAQKEADQKTAGAVAASQVARSLGGQDH